MTLIKANLQKWASVIVFLVLFILFSILTLAAQTRRALLVGIDNYAPGGKYDFLCRKEWKNLEGCLNDVESVKGILVSRFRFNPTHIHTLKDKEATKQRILSDFERYLIQETGPGDICVFYFSGHGSQVKNLKSDEPDGMDETLVPADWYKVRDIRDKELKKFYNRVLDKKAQLTVIVDACHSGSTSRDIMADVEYKFLSPDECFIEEPPDNEKSPAERGALIFSASSDFDGASPIVDEDGNGHGLFTWALVNVLKSVSIDEPSGNILQQTNMLMQSEGKRQRAKLHIPNLEALPELRKKPLFGVKPGENCTTAAAVSAVNIKNKTVELQSGLAVGIRQGCELKKITLDSNESPVLLQVTSVEGFNRSSAKVKEGNIKQVKIADLFEIHRWAAPDEKKMPVWIQCSSLPVDELNRMSNEMTKLRESIQLEWVDDPTEKQPDLILSWKEPYWFLKILNDNNHLEEVKLGKKPGAEEILAKVIASRSGLKEKLCFFLQLPLGNDLVKIMTDEIQRSSDIIKILSSNKGAVYHLVGRSTPIGIEYAWLLPDVTRTEEDFPLPFRTKWVTAIKDEGTFQEIVKKLNHQLLSLARIRAWLQLSSPSDSGNFPYHLGLKNARTGEIKTRGPLFEGETYGLVLLANKEKLDRLQELEKRYVYVFTIDSNGKGTRLFPTKEKMNIENHFPLSDEKPEVIPLGSKELFDITSPFGMDIYFLLTTDEAITNPDVLDFEGVRGGTGKVQFKSPLERLLYEWGSPFRTGGDKGNIPVNWSIERLSILSKANKK